MSLNFQFTIEENTAAPVIIPIKPLAGELGVSPVEPIRIRLEHETGINIDTITIAVNGVYYVINGAPVVDQTSFSYVLDGSSIVVDGFQPSSTQVDVTLKIPAPYPSPGTQTVFVSVENLGSLIEV